MIVHLSLCTYLCICAESTRLSKWLLLISRGFVHSLYVKNDVIFVSSFAFKQCNMRCCDNTNINPEKCFPEAQQDINNTS